LETVASERDQRSGEFRRLCPSAIYDNVREVDAGIALDELSDAL